MLKKVGIPLAIVVVLIAGYFIFFSGSSSEEGIDLTTKVKRDDLQVDVTVTGELEAKNSVQIMGPNGLPQARIYQVNIDDIVSEGTVVKKGDMVARLDASELMDKIREEELEVEESMNKYEQTQIDTAITLREQRDKIVNLQYDLEQKQLILEQSKFEPPATIKQNELDSEKAERALEQGKQEYQLLRRKSVSEMAQSSTKLLDDKRDLEKLQRLLRELTITAPENGMVIYVRDWDGSKKGKGSQIRTWDPRVATLPDLTSMISRTYVNEVDISRVTTGQEVEIGLDAFPDKKLTGKVTQVANIGEQRPNSDAKVFEVTVEVNENDTTLRPAMTTSNAIITNYIEDVLLVPLEAIHSQGDSLTYVFKKTGLSTVKQQINLGTKGNDMVVVAQGLEENDEVFLSIPNNAEDKPIAYLEEGPQPLTDRGND
ncbi:efflux RND transporter periplasmic adaptor subunit [Tunicatimonas pelagia]|uniref:efflux RND transporter periplasmic adaptor subunit n=1 Tax=Tunicatimonas pelagia TaxID=931531 RepID=UPI002665BBCD|nr:efflux RND transporter periplasmic adaptor subunit [Tunicatimonas pelagia]WKN46017.1 efflux RND transporter periplasmic adaptor subunit [Tunicatimonas pelagia]